VGVRILPAQDRRLWKRGDIGVRGARVFERVFHAPEVAFAIAIDGKNLADRHAHGPRLGR
jgi:hypothetical protein